MTLAIVMLAVSIFGSMSAAYGLGLRLGARLGGVGLSACLLGFNLAFAAYWFARLVGAL